MNNLDFNLIEFAELTDEDILYIKTLFTQPVSNEFKLYTLIYLFTNITLSESLETFESMCNNPSETMIKIIDTFNEMIEYVDVKTMTDKRI